jgi:hypothetical protein
MIPTQSQLDPAARWYEGRGRTIDGSGRVVMAAI